MDEEGPAPGAVRDSATAFVRAVSWLAAASAVLGSWLFSALAVTYFAGQAEASQGPVPPVPVLDSPVQSPPPVIVKVVHQGASSTAAPRPPAHRPAAPVPPARPVCRSTPSKPC